MNKKINGVCLVLCLGSLGGLYSTEDAFIKEKMRVVRGHLAATDIAPDVVVRAFARMESLDPVDIRLQDSFEPRFERYAEETKAFFGLTEDQGSFVLSSVDFNFLQDSLSRKYLARGVANAAYTFFWSGLIPQDKVFMLFAHHVMAYRKSLEQCPDFKAEVIKYKGDNGAKSVFLREWLYEYDYFKRYQSLWHKLFEERDPARMIVEQITFFVLYHFMVADVQRWIDEEPKTRDDLLARLRSKTRRRK